MPTVLLICTATSTGGMQRVVCALARGLSQAGVQVRTLFPESDGRTAMVEWCRRQGVVADTHPAVIDAAEEHSFRSALTLRNVVRQINPDLVHFHYGDNFLSFWDLVGARSAGLRRGVVASVHGTTSSRRKHLLTAVGSRAADAVNAFASGPTAQLLDAGVPRNRLATIPCGVAPPNPLATRSSARTALGIPPDQVVIGTMARLIESKGIDVVIDAVDCELLRGVTLLIGGDGPSKGDLEALAAGRPGLDIRFLGHVEDTGVFFAACDVFTLASRTEGFGLVFIEAAMYGIPSVGTRVGGVPDAVIHGETGLLVSPDDTQGLREALVELVTSTALRSRLGTRAKKRAIAEFSESVMIDNFVELYGRCGLQVPTGRNAESAARPGKL